MNPGTAGGGSETVVGPHSVFLANCACRRMIAVSAKA